MPTHHKSQIAMSAISLLAFCYARFFLICAKYILKHHERHYLGYVHTQYAESASKGSVLHIIDL